MAEQNGDKKTYEISLGDFLVAKIDADSLVWNPKTSTMWVRIFEGVDETTFNGKKYLWNHGKKVFCGGKRIPFVFEDNVREGAFILFYFYTGSWKNPHKKFLALFRVANVGESSVELVNEVNGKKYNVDVENLVLVKDLNDCNWTELKNEVLNAGYSVSSKYEMTNVASYIVLKQILSEQSDSSSSDLTSEEEESVQEEDVDECVDVFAKFKGGVRPVFKDLEEEKEREKEFEEMTGIPVTKEGWEEYKEKKKEMQERIEKQTMPSNLQKVKIICFDLPSEYRGSQTSFDYKNRHAVIKFSEKVDITKVRTLRRQFYRLLNQFAWRSMVGWILMRDADLSKLDDVITMLNNEFGERRVIYLVEAYLPKDTVVEWLEYYIAEVKAKAEELENKMNEKADDQKALRRLKSEWKKTMELIKRLYDEMKYLKSPSN